MPKLLSSSSIVYSCLRILYFDTVGWILGNGVSIFLAEMYAIRLYAVT